MAHTPRSLLDFQNSQYPNELSVTYVIERSDDAVLSFFTAHQPYADMPIRHAHTRIGPFWGAKARAIARAAAANPTYKEPASRGTKRAILRGSLTLSGLPMGLALMAGKKEAMNGTRREEPRDSRFRLKVFAIKATYSLTRQGCSVWHMHCDA